MKSHQRSHGALCLLIGCAALIAVGAGDARAADPAKEVATAQQHAGYAAAGKDLKAVQMHLHHVVNCLVGPNGEGFDAKELNPCKALGAGAIPDTSDAAKKQELEEALKQAQQGLSETGLAAAQKSAAASEASLKRAI